MIARTSRAPASRLTPVTLQRRWPLVAWMLAAIGVVTALAWWDQQREAEAALRDLGSEQRLLAISVCASLRARLGAIERDAILMGEHGTEGALGRYEPAAVRAQGAPPTPGRDPSRLILAIPLSDGRIVDLGVSAADLLGRDARLETPGQLTVMVAPPGETSLHAVDGRVLSSLALHDALDKDFPTLRLNRNEAAALGLWERTAIAGLTHADTEHFGRWDVVAVATAARERDRDARAFRRLVLSVGFASGLVLAFGGLALRKQRKELELARELAVAEVEQARDEELQRASRVGTMGTFAMGIAHEVSTPLGVIVGRAEQLAGRLRDDERGARAAQTILQQADHIRNIVRKFLDLARGGLPAFGRADPSDIVRDAVSAVEHRFAKASVSLESDIPSAMPFIQCDRALLEHAIVNLLLNACEASTSGGHVEVRARSDADRVAFVVTDDGIGISPEHAARVTEPFFTTKPEGSGTGLGLAIATEIAKSHRGDLTIAANVPRGTRASIEIPVATHRGDESGQP